MGGPNLEATSAEEKFELFQLNLVFALASINQFRKGQCDKHPFGYFTAGLKHLSGIVSFESTKDVQGLLLIAHFGLYYYIGISIWEIGQICLRICIEQGLHKGPRTTPANLLIEQMRRRIFWSCYQLDRLSSVTLGRPYGIEDADIEIALPFDAEDEFLSQMTQFPPIEVSSLSGRSASKGEVAVFNCSVQLGRIGCRIHNALRAPYQDDRQQLGPRVGNYSYLNEGLGPGDTYQLFRDFSSELRAWRLSCPMFLEPQCVFQTKEWF